MKNHSLKFYFILAILQLTTLAGCDNSRVKNSSNNNSNELKGNISISGAFALYPMTVRWAEEFQKLHPKVRIDISAGGAGKGMTDALSGMVDLGMFSREVRDAEVEKGAWKIALTRDAVLPTINANNPFIKEIKARGVNQKGFENIFLKNEVSFWGSLLENKQILGKINVYTRSDACGAAGMWAKYLGGYQEDLKGVGVFGDPGMADAIRKDKLGLGYNNVVYIYDINSRKKYKGLEVLPIDINNNGVIDEDEDFYDTLDEIMSAIKEGKYPSPPARDLYFVSKGKPQNPEVIEFIKWILTEGQQFVNEAGYVQLSDKKIKEELDKIK